MSLFSKSNGVKGAHALIENREFRRTSRECGRFAIFSSQPIKEEIDVVARIIKSAASCRTTEHNHARALQRTPGPRFQNLSTSIVGIIGVSDSGFILAMAVS
jgi:hypothetical protein